LKFGGRDLKHGRKSSPPEFANLDPVYHKIR
jgi:hypothetical protein